jgi:hypothetical protein
MVSRDFAVLFDWKDMKFLIAPDQVYFFYFNEVFVFKFLFKKKVGIVSI